MTGPRAPELPLSEKPVCPWRGAGEPGGREALCSLCSKGPRATGYGPRATGCTAGRTTRRGARVGEAVGEARFAVRTGEDSFFADVLCRASVPFARDRYGTRPQIGPEERIGRA